MNLLRRMQSLLAGLYDAPVEHDVGDFLVCDRRRFAQVVGARTHCEDDEQVFVIEDRHGVQLGVYIDERVLARLERRDPTELLDDDNLGDFCTALEGVSHFHYLVWSLTRARPVSLLELELQAEVDKYAVAMALLTRQRAGMFPRGLHARMFDAVTFSPQPDETSRRRYEVANRHAARYCRSLDDRFLRPRRLRPDMWLAELRRFFRWGHQEKLRRLAV